MASIRVNTGNINVEVNDRGDYITLYADLGFIKKIEAFLEGLSNLKEDYNRELRNIDESDTDGKTELLYNFHHQIYEGINMLFGVEACKKIFGEGVRDVVPNIYQVEDFFTQLIPFITQLANNMKKNVKQNPKKYKDITKSNITASSAFERLRGTLDDNNDEDDENESVDE